MFRIFKEIGIILENIVEIFESRRIMREMYQKKAEKMRKI